jgi:hypothetical protein
LIKEELKLSSSWKEGENQREKKWNPRGQCLNKRKRV